MKRLPFVKTLALFILIAALTITFVGCASKELTDVPPADVAAAIIAATGRDQDTLSNSSEYFEGDKFLEYIASRYGITLTSADNAAVFGADYPDVYEIAVFRFDNSQDASDAVEKLTKFISNVEKGFENYEPEQAFIAHNSIAVSSGCYAALLLCDNPSDAKTAFNDAVHE